MTLAHFVYIPGILLVGLVIGWILGGRSARATKADADDRDARRAARAARRERGEPRMDG